MKNLKVSAKLLVGFGVSAAFLLMVGVVSIISLYNLNDEYNDAITEHGMPLGDAAHVLEAVHTIRAEIRGSILFTGNKDKVIEFRNDIERQFKQFEEATGKFGKALDSHPSAKALMTEAMDKYDRVFKPSVRKILDGAERGAPKEELLSEMLSNTTPTVDLISTNMRKCTDFDLEELHESVTIGVRLATTVIVIMVILTVLCSPP